MHPDSISKFLPGFPTTLCGYFATFYLEDASIGTLLLFFFLHRQKSSLYKKYSALLVCIRVSFFKMFFFLSDFVISSSVAKFTLKFHVATIPKKKKITLLNRFSSIQWTSGDCSNSHFFNPIVVNVLRPSLICTQRWIETGYTYALGFSWSECVHTREWCWW